MDISGIEYATISWKKLELLKAISHTLLTICNLRVFYRLMTGIVVYFPNVLALNGI